MTYQDRWAPWAGFDIAEGEERKYEVQSISGKEKHIISGREEKI